MSDFFDKLKARRGQVSDTGFGSNKPKRAEWFRPKEEGSHGLYTCPSGDPDDPYPCIPIAVHYKVGDEEKMHVCTAEDNIGLWSPHTLAAIQRKNDRVRKEHPDWVVDLKPGLGCPTCDRLADPASGLSAKQIKDQRRQDLMLWQVKRMYLDPRKGARQDTPDGPFQPWFASTYQSEQIIDAITAGRLNVFDPEKAILTLVTRTGKNWDNTRYSIALDVASAAKPIRLSDADIDFVNNFGPGQKHDPYDLIAALVRDRKTLLDWNGYDEEEPESNDPPECFGDPSEYDPNDEAYCQPCAFNGDCARKVAAKAGKKGKKWKKAASDPEVVHIEETEPESESDGLDEEPVVHLDESADDDAAAESDGIDDDDFLAALDAADAEA